MRYIGKPEALSIARAECERRGWPWRGEQTTVQWGLFTYSVWSGGRKGGNFWARIRKRDGKVLAVGMTPK
jgi:hypothetical protein